LRWGSSPTAPPRVRSPGSALDRDVPARPRRRLKAVTGTPGRRASDEEAGPEPSRQEKGCAERLRREVLEAPLVKAAFEAFPEAELAGFRLDETRSA
jgi:DNA polymerase-3 subunit gamma/tau